MEKILASLIWFIKEMGFMKKHLYAPDGSGGDEVAELREIIEK